MCASYFHMVIFCKYFRRKLRKGIDKLQIKTSVCLCVGRQGFMVCRMFEAPSFYILSPYMTIPTLYGFPKTSTFDNTCLCIAPIKYQIHTQINPCGKVISSSLEDHKTTFHTIFMSSNFTMLRFVSK